MTSMTETATAIDSETASAIDSKTDSKPKTGFTFKSNLGSWADYTDSEDDEPEPVKPVPAPVPAPVQPKTWGKLPDRVEPVRVEPVREQKPNNGIRTLMVKNLPRDTTPEKLTNELRSIFKAYGPIKDVYIPINRDGTYAGTIKGFAKVQFQNADHSAIAVSQSITIRKNKLVIEFAKEDR
jgi:RNA recognition motif-containing protein